MSVDQATFDTMRGWMEDWKSRAEKAEAALAAKEVEVYARNGDLREAWSERDEWQRRCEISEREVPEWKASRLATARAVMAEEAARKSESYGEIGMRPAAEIRALAPLPAGLVVLPVELAEWITDHLTTELRNMNESDSCDDCGTLDDHESDCFALELERRIAALDAAGGGR